jgi:hypothetical protein
VLIKTKTAENIHKGGIFHTHRYSKTSHLISEMKPAGLKFVPELLLSLDIDNICREPELKAAYIFSGRYS